MVAVLHTCFTGEMKLIIFTSRERKKDSGKLPRAPSPSRSIGSAHPIPRRFRQERPTHLGGRAFLLYSVTAQPNVAGNKKQNTKKYWDKSNCRSSKMLNIIVTSDPGKAAKGYNYLGSNLRHRKSTQ